MHAEGGAVTASAEGLRALQACEEAFHGLDPAFPALCDQALQVEPGLPMVHLMRALFGRQLGLPQAPQDELAALGDRALTDREASLRAGAAALAQGGPYAAAPLLAAHAERFPLDLVGTTAAMYALLLSGRPGNLDAALAVVEAAAQRHGRDWRVDGLLAMSRQEQGRLDEAGVLAEQVLAERPRAGAAAHALTHVHYETGTHAAGQAWMDGWLADGSALMYESHFPWHAALHALALGDAADALRRYREGVRPSAVPDAGSLLWRCRLLGEDPAAVDALAPAAAQGVTPVLAGLPAAFPVLCAALALAAAGDAEGLGALSRRCAADPRPGFADAVAPLTDALRLLLEDRAAQALVLLEAVEPEVPRVGGSRAQREVVEDTLLEALVRAGRLEQARQRLLDRLERREHAGDRLRLAVLPAPALS